MRSRKIIIITLAALAVVACSAAPRAHTSQSETAKPLRNTAIVIDTDMGLDDVRAIFALLASNSDIHAIITVEGSAAVGTGTDNLVGLLESIPRNDIIVRRGIISPLREPPPWRHTANTLGGGTFPPPRRLASRAVTPDGLARLLVNKHESFHCLALGPLCNIAGLVRERPDALRAVETLWIPARIDSVGAVTGWNLERDIGATTAVLRDVPNIILVDVSDAAGIDARTILSEVCVGAVEPAMHSMENAGKTGGRVAATDRPSPAVRWIARTLSGADTGHRHFFFHDELAAAVLIEPEIAAVSSDSYRSSLTGGGAIVLEKNGTGNIRIAHIADLARVIETLKSKWLSPVPAAHRHAGHGRLPAAGPAHADHAHGAEHTGEDEIHEMHAHGGTDRTHAAHPHTTEHGDEDHPHASTNEAKKIPTGLLLRTFHGHLGPYVVLGYRMGRLALEATGSTGHFGIEADVYSMLEPPPSCLIDGVQLGSGCTMGKRNISIHGTDGPAYADFTVEKRLTIRISLKREVPDLVTRLVDEHGVEEAGRRVLEMATDELFEIEITAPAGEN